MNYSRVITCSKNSNNKIKYVKLILGKNGKYEYKNKNCFFLLCLKK